MSTMSELDAELRGLNAPIYGGDLFTTNHAWRMFGVVQRCKWCYRTRASVRDAWYAADCPPEDSPAGTALLRCASKGTTARTQGVTALLP